MKKIQKMLAFAREASKYTHVYGQDEEAPYPIPSNFRRVNADILKKEPELLNSFIECYQDVFGQSDVWGEGYICQQCGSTIPIEEYVEFQLCDATLDGGDTPCMGQFEQFHKTEDLRKRILSDTCDKQNPAVAILMLNPKDEKQVLGFIWGVVKPPTEIAKMIVYPTFSADKVYGKFLYDLILYSIYKLGQSPLSNIFYLPEMGIKKSIRNGAGPLAYLVRSLLEYVDQNGSMHEGVFWTIAKSSLLKLMTLSGCRIFFEFDFGGKTYYLLAGGKIYRDIIRIYQNLSPQEISKVYKDSSREQETALHFKFHENIHLFID